MTPRSSPYVPSTPLPAWSMWFVPRNVTDPLESRIYASTAIVLLQVAVCFAALLPLWAWMSDDLMPAMLVFPLLCVAAFGLIATGRQPMAVHAMSAITVAHWALLGWWTGGTNSPFIVCMGLAALFPAMYRRVVGMTVWASFSMMMFALIALLEGLGGVPGPTLDRPFLLVIPMGAIVGATALTVLQLVNYSIDVTLTLAGTHDDLAKARDSAREANEAKSAFLAAMSHEIREPINGVLGVVGLLSTTELDRQQQDYIETIRTSSNALVDLVEDILDFSSIEAGRVRINTAPFEPVAIARQVTELLRVRAKEKGLRLDLEVGTGVPGRLMGDGGRVRQILFNLIGNAVKYTESGSITVRLLCVHRTTTQAHVRIEVQDTGVGIPPEDLERIFERFTQVGGTHVKRAGGTGLGLAITKLLVDLMGGTLAVTSKPEQGSVFSVDITLPTEVTLVSEDELPQLPAARILLAEDNPVNRKVTIAMLDHLGCVGDTATNGELAVRMASAHAYDLILMDCEMPLLDGYEATRRLRASGATMPIIAMTGHTLPEHRRKCEDAGMTGFLVKPVHMDQLHRVLAHWLTEQ